MEMLDELPHDHGAHYFPEMAFYSADTILYDFKNLQISIQHRETNRYQALTTENAPVQIGFISTFTLDVNGRILQKNLTMTIATFILQISILLAGVLSATNNTKTCFRHLSMGKTSHTISRCDCGWLHTFGYCFLFREYAGFCKVYLSLHRKPSDAIFGK
ncbi:MAG: hypothetical protein IPG07_06985 [Crocinitomicaceae bacterium]|nr:hypothetical protein [Crocinitomicaceae bacterium]